MTRGCETQGQRSGASAPLMPPFSRDLLPWQRGFRGFRKTIPHQSAAAIGHNTACSERASHATAAVWSQRVLWLLLALGTGRLFYCAAVPLELCADEAYYWDWSRQLDWGYYSKPPMIAWLLATSTALGGTSEFVIRLPAVLLGTIGLWPVYRLGSRLFSPRVGFWSVVAVATTPGLAALALLMTIDAPFLCCWAFALWCAWELLEPDEPGWNWVLPAVVATGLGLLSKQTMIALLPLSAIFLLLQPAERRKLASPKIWAWWLGSLACLTPVLWWNRQHQWVTARHTQEHFQQPAATAMQRLNWFLEFWGGQLGVVGPVACVLMIGLTVYGLATWTAQDRRVRFLLCFGAGPMLCVALLATTRPLQPNWPVAFVLPSFLLLSAWGCGEWPAMWKSSSRTLMPRASAAWSPLAFRVAWGSGIVMATGAMLVPFVLPHSSLAGGRFDVTARLRGWRELSCAVESAVPAPDAHRSDGESRQPLWIAVTGRGPVSLLAYHLSEQPRVYRWNPGRVRDSQHEIWGGPDDSHRGATAILLTHADCELPEELQAAFGQITFLDTVSTHLGGSRREELTVWRGDDFRGWPPVARETVRDSQSVVRTSLPGIRQNPHVAGLDDELSMSSARAAARFLLGRLAPSPRTRDESIVHQ